MPVGCNWCLTSAVQVSEKILLLDAEAKELRLAAAAADNRAEVLGREKMQVMGLAEELRADVAAKMTLLDEFEARFARQYRYACICTVVFCLPGTLRQCTCASGCKPTCIGWQLLRLPGVMHLELWRARLCTTWRC
jgi:hypothetical protein